MTGIGHAEAMRLTATENARLLAQLRGVTDEQWRAPTDCSRWTVRDVVVHLIASAQAQADPIEFVRQVVAGRPLTAEHDGRIVADIVAEWSRRHGQAYTLQRCRHPAPQASTLTPASTFTEALRTLAQRFADEIINGRDLDAALTELVVEDFVEPNPLPGRVPAAPDWPTCSPGCSPPSRTCTGRCTTQSPKATAS